MTVYAEHRRGAHSARWLGTIDEAYREMERLIGAAGSSIRLETYLLREDGPATWLRDALQRARARGVTVHMLLDAFGTEGVRREFLVPLRDAGVSIALFNPQRWLRRSFRNHRKLLTCDGEHAVVGGFNIGPEYAGDGVTHGWCDTGVLVGGPVVAQLEASFDAMYQLARFTPQRFRHFRLASRQSAARVAEDAPVQVLLTGPGTRGRHLRHHLGHDLRHAREVDIASAYFLPSRRLRRLLYLAAQHGRARLLLAGRSDVPLALLAAERYYGRLLSRNVQIFEYQPQILHAKLVIADNVAYVGSANLDWRSLHINYEVVLRFEWPELVADGRHWFEHALRSAEQLDRPRLNARRGLWRRFASFLSYFLLARLDALVARRGSRTIS